MASFLVLEKPQRASIGAVPSQTARFPPKTESRNAGVELFIVVLANRTRMHPWLSMK
jgi:hypothetical protein